MKRLKLLSSFLLLACTAMAQTGNDLVWKEIMPGVWSVKVGTPDKINFLSAAGVQPKTATITQMGKVPFPLDNHEIKAEVRDGKTYLKFPLQREEKLFGLGLNFKRTEVRGFAYQLRVEHYNGIDNGRTHAPVPFYVSSKGYGVLINSARYLDMWMGTSARRDSKDRPVAIDMNTDKANWALVPYSDNVEVQVPAAGAEIYIFGGPTMLDAVSRYNLYQGGGCLPPRWGLGFWHRTPSLFTQDQVANEVAEFDKQDMPISVVGLEPGWQTSAYPSSYAWDPVRFPKPADFVDRMNRSGIKVNLWLHPWVSPRSPLYKPLEPLSGSHTVWAGLAPDFTLPQTTGLVKNYFETTHLNLGVSGYKMDENDGNINEGWYFPDVAKFPSGTYGDQMHQLYGMLMQKFTTDLFRKRNQRTYGLVRASNAGAASFPYVLYNDYYSHPDFITALINSSFSGLLWTPEARSSKTSEEWVRRFQSVCFSPMAMLNAWSSGTKPWSFTDVNPQIRDIMKLRMQLIPYFYTTFSEYAFKGTPPIRAMNFLPAFTPHAQITRPEDRIYNQAVAKEVKDQYMIGDQMLVAPVFAGQEERKVILPKGKWFDFYTGKYAGSGEVITVKPGLDKIPVYIKDGGIIPMVPATNHSTGEKLPAEIRYYGTGENSYLLYDDDGSTFDYEKGAFTHIALSVKKGPDGKPVTAATVPNGAKVWSYTGFTWRIMTTP